jgi:hypothetical protein
MQVPILVDIVACDYYSRPISYGKPIDDELELKKT